MKEFKITQEFVILTEISVIAKDENQAFIEADKIMRSRLPVCVTSVSLIDEDIEEVKEF